jgi:tetratricopeptide (TPR) repeat protein
MDQERLSEAERALSRAFAIYKKTNDPQASAGVLSRLGLVYSLARRDAEAEAQYRRCLALLAAQHSRPDIEIRIARVLHVLGELYIKSGKNPEAEQALGQAVPIARRHLAEHADLPGIIESYSRLFKILGRHEESKELHWEAERARLTISVVR